jgi:hypothetical protein
MRSSRVLFWSIATLVGAAVGTPGAQAQEQDRCPWPGSVLVPDTGSGADRDGNGVVCMNPETGQVHDDVGWTRRDYDHNDNLIVCGRLGENGITIIDDQPGEDGFTSCPGPFELIPDLLP